MEKVALLPSTNVDPPREPTPSRKWVVGGGIVLLSTVAVSALLHSPPSVVKAKMASLKAKFSKESYECIASDAVSSYKYTIASSKGPEDGKWADDMFGCEFEDVTDTHGCASLGKTMCMSGTLDYMLHFAESYVTPAGDQDVAWWDEAIAKVHGDMSKYDDHMDYRMTFYAKKLDGIVVTLLGNEQDFMLRSSKMGEMTWYSALMASPSGKIFEVTSSVFDVENAIAKDEDKSRYLNADGSVIGWGEEEGTCSINQRAGHDTFTPDQLNAFVDAFGSPGDAAYLPIRNVIAVKNMDAAKAWWQSNVPSVEWEVHSGNTDTCKSMTMSLPTVNVEGTEEDDVRAKFLMETRVVQNSEYLVPEEEAEVSVGKFIDYIEAMNRKYTRVNGGWEAFYDRHIGIQFDTCPLDDYAKMFDSKGVSFNPHARVAADGVAKGHVWTEGTQGYGVEMQGFFDYTYSKCLSVFDWCTPDTVGKFFGEDQTTCPQELS
jgi:hypothetical protein